MGLVRLTALLELTSGYAAGASNSETDCLVQAHQQAVAVSLAEQTAAGQWLPAEPLFLSPVTSLRHSVSAGGKISTAECGQHRRGYWAYSVNTGAIVLLRNILYT